MAAMHKALVPFNVQRCHAAERGPPLTAAALLCVAAVQVTCCEYVPCLQHNF